MSDYVTTTDSPFVSTIEFDKDGYAMLSAEELARQEAEEERHWAAEHAREQAAMARIEAALASEAEEAEEEAQEALSHAATRRPKNFTPGRVIRLSEQPGCYLAPSDMTPEVAYFVDLNARPGERCSCKGHARWQYCRHVVRCEAASFGHAVQKARRVADEQGVATLRRALERGSYRPEVRAAIAQALKEQEGHAALLSLTSRAAALSARVQVVAA